MLEMAAQERCHRTSLFTNDQLMNHLQQDSFLSLHRPLPHYVLFTDKDIYLANTLERNGIRVFNPAEAITISDDKIKTYERLVDAYLPIPETIVGPKTFGLPIARDSHFLQAIVERFGFPFIMKEAFGSFGEQVY